MLLHNSKKLALLQLTNCMSSANVENIKQLSDGKLFSSIIETIFPEIPFYLQPKEQNIVNSDEPLQSEELQEVESEDQMCQSPKIKSEGNIKKESKSVPESIEQTESLINGNESTVVQNIFAPAPSYESECIDVVSFTVCTEQITKEEKSLLKPAKSSKNVEEASTQPIIPSVDSKPESVKDGNKEDEDISHRYKLIEYFIDVRYNLQSKMLIAFSECISGNEFELAKVAIFILSEVVRYKVHINDSIIQMLSLLDVKIQQDLEQCFNFFINERSKINLTEITNLLSSHAPYKVLSSPNKSSFSTPRRTCSSKYRRNDSPSTSPSQESVYTDSPLKKYFESPIFTRKDIISKEKEILKTREILYEEEVKSSTLQRTVKELEKRLKNKDKEINDLKTRLRELLENEKSEECEDCKKMNNTLKETEKRIRELEKDLAERESMMDIERISKEYEDKLLDYRVKVAESISGFNYQLNQAEKEIRETEALLDDTKFELLKREETINYLTEALNEKTKECEIYKEKSSEVTKVEKTPESPVPGECLGKIIEKENEELRERIKQLLLLAHPEEKIQINAMVQCPENSINCDVMNTSNVSMHELPPSTDLSVNENSIPVMIKVENVADECPIMCDIMNKQESVSKRFSGSNSADSSIENNHSPVTNDGIGSLWQLYNNSMSDDGNANGVSIFSIVEKRVTKALNTLQKIGSEFPKSSKRLRVSSGPNGSNGFVSSPLVKELMEDLKSLKKSLLCLSQTEESQVQYQNNNSISKNTQVTNVKDSKDSVVYSKCNECMKVTVELPNSTVHSVTQNFEALLEKTQELDSLKEKYKTIQESYCLKKKELETARRNYTALSKENLQNCVMLRHTEMKCQSLEVALENMKKVESEMKFRLKKEKYLFKMSMKDMRDKCKKLYESVRAQRAQVRILSDKNQKLQEDVVSYRTQNEKLYFRLKYLEKQNEERRVSPDIEPESDTSVTVVPYTRGETKHCVIKQEHLSPIKCEVTSLSVDNDESALTGALYSRSLQNPFHLHTADEESFLNHSSLAGLSKNFENGDVQNRRHELNRRNTLCMPHLQSCYPAEAVALTPADKNMCKYIDAKMFEGIKQEYEMESKEPCGKKRKVSEIKTEDQSINLLTTPAVKTKKKFKTPSSLQKLLEFRRIRRPGSIKPKP